MEIHITFCKLVGFPLMMDDARCVVNMLMAVHGDTCHVPGTANQQVNGEVVHNLVKLLS